MIECKITKEELEYIYNELHLWAKTEEEWKTVNKIEKLIRIAELKEEINKLEGVSNENNT